MLVSFGHFAAFNNKFTILVALFIGSALVSFLADSTIRLSLFFYKNQSGYVKNIDFYLKSWQNGVRYPMLGKHELIGHKIDPLPNNRTPSILIWTPINHPKSQMENSLPENFHLDCNNALRCSFTKNRTNDLSTADVVVVGWTEWVKNRPMPSLSYRRPKNQYWAFYMIESPAHTYYYDWRVSKNLPRVLADLDNFFNWTITYRRDSDIPNLYGLIMSRKTPDFSRNYDRLGDKTNGAVYMASHCGNRMSHRHEYIDQLIKDGLDVESFGCGVKKSPFEHELICHRHGDWSTDEQCLKKISKRYKFFLAFENSLCRDYLTEKFYRAAQLDTIPVVLNGVDMSLYAPPHSYINTKDFDSPRKLVAYLKKVGSDRDLFNSYFWWKPYYDVVHLFEGTGFRRNLCRWCAYIHRYLAMPQKRMVVGNIDEWWASQGSCAEGPSSWT